MRTKSDLKELSAKLSEIKVMICDVDLNEYTDDKGTIEILSGLLGYAASYMNSAQGYCNYISQKSD